MRLHLTRMVAEWLADATVGVNALLPAIPLDGTDTVPKDVAAIVNEYDDKRTAEGLEPLQLPALIVVIEDDLVYESLQPLRKQATVRGMGVGVWYLHRQEDAHLGKRNGTYTLRAVRRSLGLLDEAPQASRRRDTVDLLTFERLTEVGIARTIGQAAISGALIGNLFARDIAP